MFCALCDGPCREPFKLPPINPNYPFLPAEVIAMTQEDEAPKPEPAPIQGKRARHPSANRVKRHGENRDAKQDDDDTPPDAA